MTRERIKPLPPDAFPACFEDHAQFTLWLESARVSRCVLTPCRDCTPEYRALMERCGRCDPAGMAINFRSRPKKWVPKARA